jgi:hypothetical protein
MNGDLMADPDMVFEIAGTGNEMKMYPISYRNDYMGVDREVYGLNDKGRAVTVNLREKASEESFARTWNKNIADQGFVKKYAADLAAATAQKDQPGDDWRNNIPGNFINLGRIEMGVTVVKTIHYTCDVKGCKEHGSTERLPDGWRHIQVFEPGQGSASEKALMCPTCFAGFRMRVSLLSHKREVAA